MAPTESPALHPVGALKVDVSESLEPENKVPRPFLVLAVTSAATVHIQFDVCEVEIPGNQNPRPTDDSDSPVDVPFTVRSGRVVTLRPSSSAEDGGGS